MAPKADLDTVIQAAIGEAAKMRDASANAADTTKVEMTVPQFRKLAALLEFTARAARDGADRFDAPIDGIRFWVPLPQVEAERAEMAALRAEHDRVRLHRGWC